MSTRCLQYHDNAQHLATRTHHHDHGRLTNEFASRRLFLTPWALASLGLMACSDGATSPGGGTTSTAGGQATSTAAGTTTTGSGGSTSVSSGAAGTTSSTSTGGGSTGSGGTTGSGGGGGASGGSAGGGGSQGGLSGGTGGSTMMGDASDNFDAGGRRDASLDASGASDASRSDAGARPARVLLYSFSTLTIGTVPAQITGFKQKLEGWQYQVDESKDPAVFTDANLAKYAAVGMINTCFYPFGANKAGAADLRGAAKVRTAGWWPLRHTLRRCHVPVRHATPSLQSAHRRAGGQR